MTAVKLVATKRESTGKQAAKHLRKEGKVPVEVYGGKKENLHLSVSLIDLRKVLSEKPEVIELEVDGQVEKVRVQDIQIDTLEETILHVDFLRVAE